MSLYDDDVYLTEDSFSPGFLEHMRDMAIGALPKPRNLKPYKISAIILCAGRGERMGLPYNKLLYHIGDKTILETTLQTFCDCKFFSEILCVCAPNDFDIVKDMCLEQGVSVCLGGDTRTESCRRAIAKLQKSDIVVIHDGARPFASMHMIYQAVSSALDYGSGICAVPVVDAIKLTHEGEIVETLPRDRLYSAQTPQAFRYDEIKDAYSRIEGNYADDSEVYRLAGYKPRIVNGEYINRKVTTMADIMNVADGYKIGFGYDVHRLVPDRDVILGGVYIPYEKGLLGHSDADVLTHAIMDALLSAAGLPDIGVLFPDTDPQLKDISSFLLLKRVKDMLDERRINIINLSAVIMAEQPKVADKIQMMISALSRTLDIAPRCVNISATTTEKLGVVGDCEGIASAAAVLVGT